MSFNGNSDVTIKANYPQAGRKPKEINQSMNANIRYIKLHLYMDKLPKSPIYVCRSYDK